MIKKIYRVEQIDGDYAHLADTEEESAPLKLVARALLPADIYEGCLLKYEWISSAYIRIMRPSLSRIMCTTITWSSMPSLITGHYQTLITVIHVAGSVIYWRGCLLLWLTI